jgi:hypothetical protein
VQQALLESEAATNSFIKVVITGFSLYQLVNSIKRLVIELTN